MGRSIKYKAVKQITDSHCGPAVVQMQLNALGYDFNQEKITKKAGAEKTIPLYGTTIKELALAVRNLSPKAQFWYKDKASLQDIEFLLKHSCPVGIGWQGLFDLDEEEDKEWLEQGGYGHYSLVKDIDKPGKTLLTSEPHTDHKKLNRAVPIETFITRWYDHELDRRTKKEKHRKQRIERRLFVITKAAETFPRDIKMKKL